jgi:hypothetical protein
VISTLSLCVLILLLTFGSIAWIGPADSSAAWVIGGTWMVLTLAFEFLAGHYLFHASWSALAADYDVLHGRIWILVLVTTGVAPALADNWRRTIA